MRSELLPTFSGKILCILVLRGRYNSLTLPDKMPLINTKIRILDKCLLRANKNLFRNYSLGLYSSTTKTLVLLVPILLLKFGNNR